MVNKGQNFVNLVKERTKIEIGIQVRITVLEIDHNLALGSQGKIYIFPRTIASNVYGVTFIFSNAKNIL